MTDNKVIRELFETVGTLRDELRVQANLAKRDAKDEWHHLEEKWQSAQKERQRKTEVLSDTADEAAAGLRLVLEELRDGYRKLRE